MPLAIKFIYCFIASVYFLGNIAVVTAALLLFI